MKKIILFVIILCRISVAYSQQDCCNKVAEQGVEIRDLKEIINSKNDSIRECSRIFEETGRILQDTINKLRSDLSKFKRFKEEKKAFDTQINQLKDSIASLLNQISKKDTQISEIKQNGDLKAIQEKENGKREAFASTLNTYKGKKFDELIKSSSKESVQREKQLVGNSEVKQILDDLEMYFNAEELFSKKFDINSAGNAQNRVNLIQQQSELIIDLKNKLENFKTLNDGLKEMIEKINNIDKKESVQGMSEKIQKEKFNKILSEFTTYIFNYDFNFIDYPYLSDIVLEIIKRKRPNADADISDLLHKL